MGIHLGAVMLIVLTIMNMDSICPQAVHSFKTIVLKTNVNISLTNNFQAVIANVCIVVLCKFEYKMNEPKKRKINLWIKMDKIFLVFFYILDLLLSSCFEKNKNSNTLTFIDIEAKVENLQKVYLSQFSDVVRYIPLENNSDYPTTRITFLDFSGNFILASDGRICLLYDNEGNFIRLIGNQGRGPDEYTGIGSIFLLNEKIYIYDFYADDLIEYNLSGILLKRYKSGFLVNEKYYLENRMMINDSMILGNIENRTGQVEYKALIIDKQGDVNYYYKNYIFFKLEYGAGSGKAPGSATINKFRNKIFFKEFYNDTLFQMDEQYQLTPYCVFDLGKYREPFSKRGISWSQKPLSSYIYLKYVYQIKNFLILDCDLNKYYPVKRLTPEIIRTVSGKDYVQWYNYLGQEVLGIYNIKTGNLIFSKPTSTNNQLFTTGLYNDIDAGPRFFPDQMVNDSTMVMNIRFDYLIEHIESKDFKDNIPKFPDRKERLKFFVDSLKNTGFDNPVLMFVTFNQ